MAIGTDPTLNHLDLGLGGEDLVEIYRLMVLARRLDDRMWALNRQGRAPFVVSSSGHEATQVGAAYALDKSQDWSLPYYRDVGFVLAMGLTPEEALLGVFAKATDPCSGGRQMPNHWSLPRARIFTHSSGIGSQYPHATGIAYELKRRNQPGVVLVSGGEGSTSEGDFHEALNFAVLKRLPILFLVENNRYAISVREEDAVAGDLAARAAGYGMPATSLDGNDVLEVYRVVHEGVERARAGGGPSFVEARTYRYYAHTSDDDDKLYRSAEEVEEWRRRDPIAVFRQYLIENRLLSSHLEAEIEEGATSQIALALEKAAAAPEAADGTSGVYAEVVENREPAASVDEPLPGDEVNLITAINRALHEIMAADERVVLFGQDVADPKGGVFKATVGLTDAFGTSRAFNTPISEALIVGTGIGMAAVGARPIAEIQFADFIHPGFDQIVSEAARIHYRSGGGWQCPLVIRVPYGGGIRGALYHSQSIEAFYAHVPGLKVVVPSTPGDAAGLLRSAVEDPDPVMVLEPKKLYRLAKGPYPGALQQVPLGKAALRRAGSDLTIIAYGTMAHFALQAADRLSEEQGIEAEVLDLRSLKPLDWVSIEAAVQRTSKILIVHEDNEFLGFGAEVSAQIAEKAFEWLDAPIRRYATPDVPTFPFAAELEAEVMPSTDGIMRHAAELAAY